MKRIMSGMLALAMLLLIGGLAGCHDGGGGQVAVSEAGPEGGSDVAPADDLQDGDSPEKCVKLTIGGKEYDYCHPLKWEGKDEAGEECSSIEITTKIYVKKDGKYENTPSLEPAATDPEADINFSSDAEEVRIIWTSSSPVESWDYEVRFMDVNKTLTKTSFAQWTTTWTATPLGKDTYQLTIPTVGEDKVYAFVTIQPVATVGDCSQKGAQLRFTMDK